jgi:hypothetical protein
MRFYDLDIDVKNYAKRIVDAGHKCPADINSVSDFVKGLKILNLWGDIVFWTFRAGQNAGSGTTAYSLSGLGTYNGTLTNGPTWQANGIRSTGVGIPPPNIILNNTNLSSYSQRTFFAVINPLANTADNIIAITSNYGFSFAGSGAGMHLGGSPQYNYIQAGQNGNYSEVTGTTLTLSIFSSIALTYNAGPIAFYRNGAANGTNSSGTLRTLTDTNPIRLMAMNGGTLNDRGLNGTFAFFADIRIALSADQILGLNSLYKSTLGKGLALP